jgi:hypothetical protein
MTLALSEKYAPDAPQPENHCRRELGAEGDFSV